MVLLQVLNPDSGVPNVLFFGTIGMLVLTIGLIVFIIFHQRKVIIYQLRLQKMEQDQQKTLLKSASASLQISTMMRVLYWLLQGFTSMKILSI